MKADSRYDTATKSPRVAWNVRDLRAEPPALGWMEGRARPPKRGDKTRLPGGGPMVGPFWDKCRSQRKCTRPPYDRLLSNPVLKADYHVTDSDMGEQQPSLNERC